MNGPVQFVDPDEEIAPPTPPQRQQHTAQPEKRSRRKPEQNAHVIGRTPPHSLEAEEYLLSCCFLDGRSVVEACLDRKMAGPAFYAPANRVIFEKLVELYRKSPQEIDLQIVAEELKTSRQLDEIGSYAYLTQISSRIPTTAQSGYFIEKVMELHTLRELIKVASGAVEDCYAYEGGLEELTQKVDATLRKVIDGARGKQVFEAVSAMNFSYPTTDDPNSLLGHEDWLGRGGGLLFVSHAGAGKSSLIIDACMEWCRARPFMGIPSQGNHKILVIQSEDSERYIGKVIDSYCAANQLTDEERAHIGERLLFVKIKGLQGEAFLAELERQIRRHQPDLVVINPVYLYIQGSVSDDETASAFLSGLDRINANNGDRVGYILVHHTGKPPKATEEKRDTMDWETVYAGIGTSFWANWPRCSMLLEPRKDQGRYYLRLGKAGTNAGVVREYQIPDGMGGLDKVVESVTKIPIKHSQQMLDVNGQARRMIAWEADTDDVGTESTATENKEAGSKRRNELYSDEEVADYFPHAASEGKAIAVIARMALEGCGIREATFHRRRTDLLEAGWIIQTGKFYRRTSIGDDYVSAWLAKRSARGQ